MFEQLIFLIKEKPEFRKIFNDNMMKKIFLIAKLYLSSKITFSEKTSQT